MTKNLKEGYMKNLKKSLALILVLVFALGMIPFASAETAHMNVDDFTDSASIVNREAADVLAALGVYRGDEGMFRPEGNFTRVFAATLMVRVMRGNHVLGEPAQVSTPFTDVPRSHWASGYVAEAVRLGLVVGTSPTTFHPNREITRAEVAILLLRALGYGQNGEYNGNNWINQAIFDGQRYGVLPRDTTTDYTAIATRDDVALYTFRALRMSWVEFNPFTEAYHNTNQDVFGQTPGAIGQSLGEARFVLTPRSGDDDVGFETVQWLVRGQPVTEPHPQTEGIVAEFIAGADHTKHYMATNYTWPALSTDWPTTGIRFWVNGAPVTITWNTRDQLFDRGETNAWPFPAGAKIYLIDSLNPDSTRDGIVDRIIIQYELLGVVSQVDTNRGTITARVYLPDRDTLSLITVPIFAEGFSRDDDILVSPRNASITSLPIDNHTKTTGIIQPDLGREPYRVVAVNTLSGTATRAAGNFGRTFPGELGSFQSVTVGGNAIPLSAGIGMGFAENAGPSFTDESLFYLDSNGLIIGYEAAIADVGAAGLDYIFINDVGFSSTGMQSGGGDLFVSGVSTTGTTYDKIQVASVSIGGNSYPNIQLWNATTSSVVGERISTLVDFNGQARGFNATTSSQVYNNQGRWMSYELNDAGDRISLKDIRPNVVFPSSNTSLLNRPNANQPVIQETSTQRNVNEGTRFVIIDDGVKTTDVTGVANFPSGFNNTGYIDSTTAITGSTLVKWLVIMAEPAATPNSLATPERVAQIYVVRGQTAHTANYGIIIEQLGGARVGGRDVQGYRVLRAGGIVEGTAQDPIWIDGATAIAEGTILTTVPHSNATAAAAGVLAATLTPPNAATTTSIATTTSYGVINGTITVVDPLGDQHLLVTDDTMFVRFEAGTWHIGEHPRREDDDFEADEVTVWWLYTAEATRGNVIAVVAIPGATK